MTVQEYKKQADYKLLNRAGITTVNKVFIGADEVKSYEAKGVEVYPEHGYTDSKYYYCEPVEISEEDIELIKEYQVLRNMRIIKNCLVYFTVLSIIGLSTYIIALIVAWAG